MSKGIDLARFPSLEKIVSSAPDTWSDSNVPLAQRGVRLSWLVGVMRNLLEDVNRPRAELSAEAQRAFDHNQAGTRGFHDQPDMEVPSVPDYALLNVRSLVDHFVLPITGELLRGSLLERTIRHTKGCPKCARGEGHHVFVLTVTYPGGRTRQLSVRRERVAEVRRWLSNYQDLKEAIETVCELNHELLRPDRAASKRRRKQHD